MAGSLWCGWTSSSFFLLGLAEARCNKNHLEGPIVSSTTACTAAKNTKDEEDVDVIIQNFY